MRDEAATDPRTNPNTGHVCTQKRATASPLLDDAVYGRAPLRLYLPAALEERKTRGTGTRMYSTYNSKLLSETSGAKVDRPTFDKITRKLLRVTYGDIERILPREIYPRDGGTSRGLSARRGA